VCTNTEAACGMLASLGTRSAVEQLMSERRAEAAADDAATAAHENR
jgi:flagellin-like hook-associated protein FlgL